MLAKRWIGLASLTRETVFNDKGHEMMISTKKTLSSLYRKAGIFCPIIYCVCEFSVSLFGYLLPKRPGPG